MSDREIMGEAFRAAASLAETAAAMRLENAAAVIAEALRQRARECDPGWEAREKAKWDALVERVNRQARSSTD